MTTHSISNSIDCSRAYLRGSAYDHEVALRHMANDSPLTASVCAALKGGYVQHLHTSRQSPHTPAICFPTPRGRKAVAISGHKWPRYDSFGHRSAKQQPSIGQSITWARSNRSMCSVTTLVGCSASAASGTPPPCTSIGAAHKQHSTSCTATTNILPGSPL